MPEYENAVLENIFERRSCKKYKEDPVPEKLIDRVKIGRASCRERV